jgi:hypothetical protein
MIRNTILALLVTAEATRGQAFSLKKTYDSGNFLDSFDFRDVRHPRTNVSASKH